MQSMSSIYDLQYYLDEAMAIRCLDLLLICNAGKGWKDFL